MLTTESYDLNTEIEELDDQIEALEAEQESYDESTDEYDALDDRIDILTHLRTGLYWQRDEEDWGGATITFGALTAGEEAVMHRAMPANATRQERRLWFVAASTVAAPYGVSRNPDDPEPLTESIVEENFAAVAGDGIHGGFVQWAEAKANSLGVPGGLGNATNSEMSS